MRNRDVELVILDYLVEAPASFQQLCSAEADVLFNRPHHGLGSLDLLSVINGMIDRGVLERCQISGCEFYRITAAGGREWEASFRPNWDLYIGVESWYRCNKEFLRLVCNDRSVLENISARYLSGGKFVWRIKEVELRRPFYWKVLKGGSSMLVMSLDGDFPDDLNKYLVEHSGWGVVALH